MIEFQNVSKAFANKKILDHANFTIKDQEFFCVSGAEWKWENDHFKND